MDNKDKKEIRENFVVSYLISLLPEEVQQYIPNPFEIIKKIVLFIVVMIILFVVVPKLFKLFKGKNEQPVYNYSPYGYGYPGYY